MGWTILVIALLIIGAFGGDDNEGNCEESSFVENQANRISTPDNSFISHVEPPEYKGDKGIYTYTMLVRVRGNKYARQEYITIEAHNRQEAKQKAVNMGYDVIRSN